MNRNVSASATNRQKPVSSSPNTGTGGNKIIKGKTNLAKLFSSQHDVSSVAPFISFVSSNDFVKPSKITTHSSVPLHDGERVNNTIKPRTKREINNNNKQNLIGGSNSLESGSNISEDLDEVLYDSFISTTEDTLIVDSSQSRSELNELNENSSPVSFNTHDVLESSEIWEKLVKGLLSKEKYDNSGFTNFNDDVTENLINNSDHDISFDALNIVSDVDNPNNIRAKKDNIKLIEKADSIENEELMVVEHNLNNNSKYDILEMSRQSNSLEVIEITENIAKGTSNDKVKSVSTEGYKLIQQDFPVFSYDLDENLTDDDFTEVAYDYDVHEEQIQPFINSDENDVQRLWNEHTRTRSEQTQEPELVDAMSMSNSEVLSTPSTDLNIHDYSPLKHSTSQKYEHIPLKTDAPLDLFPISAGNNVLVNISISGTNTPIYVLSLSVPTGQNPSTSLSMPFATLSVANNDESTHKTEKSKETNAELSDLNAVANTEVYTKSPSRTTLVPGYRIWGGQCQCSCPCMNYIEKPEDKDYGDDKDWDVDYTTPTDATSLNLSTSYNEDDLNETTNSSNKIFSTEFSTEFFSNYTTTQDLCTRVDYWAENPPPILILEGMKNLY